IATKDANDKAELQQAQSLLAEAEQAQCKSEAAALLTSAVSAVDHGNTQQGTTLLRNYLSHAGTQDRPNAERLLHEIDIAISECAAKQTLSALPDQQLDKLATSRMEGEVQQLQHLTLRELYRATLLRALADVRKDRAAAAKRSAE